MTGFIERIFQAIIEHDDATVARLMHQTRAHYLSAQWDDANCYTYDALADLTRESSISRS